MFINLCKSKKTPHKMETSFTQTNQSQDKSDPKHKMKGLVDAVIQAYEEYVESVVPKRKRRSGR